MAVTAAKPALGVDEPPREEPPPLAADGPSGANIEVFVASHDILFVEVPSSPCDACGVPLADLERTEGYGIAGRGVYLWARGGDTRIETVPLCASCASAIGMTALARWEIEEEEG